MRKHPSESPAFYTLFETSIGPCGLAWNGRGVIGFQLPEGDVSATRGRLAKRFPGIVEVSPPQHVQGTITDVAALLQGEARDLTGVALNMDDVPDFDRRVYEIARGIPPGRVLTYGEVASRLGINNARAIGQALGRNPFAVIVPCHRVVAANGRPGGFSANGGATTKRRLLAIEGARRDESPTLFDLMSEG
ncbi:methylated-DNA--[protein]-cysteine S-methyltransferase [Microvirga sp. Mcv34]|uniref:methylated-DNA--[protein]-cysteine S-methyltransferase n=1 Tax=Microvirga sp. Mcv34 TaxID=2926016 RepID=UPI0021C7CD69|nr:methylated-DNA--[protein]-cysteine S-methyltransferase [Microvirga sp. Mcv34]